jgi:predicted RNA-binding protein associated with RNAse of E/G family
MLQRPGESYAIWVFWFGPEREFRGWYVNLQEPFRRTELGYDTQDLELDIWVPASGGWELMDDDVLEERIHEGRFTGEQVAATRTEAKRVTDELDAGRRWWPDEWIAWRPDPTWATPTFPE